MSKTITIELPEEFIELCGYDQTSPETVLRGFIADLCSIESMFVNPRTDGYNSHGSDERNMAWDYYERVGYNHAQYEE